MTDEEIKTLWVEVWRKRGLIVEPDEEEIEALRELLAGPSTILMPPSAGGTTLVLCAHNRW